MKRFFARLARALVFGVVIFFGSCIGVLATLNLLDPPTTMVQIQRRVESWFSDGEYDKRYRFVPIDSIDGDLHWAVIASEDGRFYEHWGVDWQAVEKAVEEFREGDRLRGASTITQQLAKNLFLTTHRNVVRKGLEIPLAYLTDLLLSKRRILELYLNVVEWGPGVYGAEAAAQYHYGKSATRLTRNEAARLAACLPDPRRRKPHWMDRMSRSIMVRMRQLGH